MLLHGRRSEKSSSIPIPEGPVLNQTWRRIDFLSPRFWVWWNIHEEGSCILKTTYRRRHQIMKKKNRTLSCCCCWYSYSFCSWLLRISMSFLRLLLIIVVVSCCRCWCCCGSYILVDQEYTVHRENQQVKYVTYYRMIINTKCRSTVVISISTTVLTVEGQTSWDTHEKSRTNTTPIPVQEHGQKFWWYDIVGECTQKAMSWPSKKMKSGTVVPAYDKNNNTHQGIRYILGIY